MNLQCETCAYGDKRYSYTYKCRYCNSVYDDTGTAPEYVDVNRVCGDYIGVACIDGTCPNANEEYNLPMPCADCFYYKGCEDCAAPEMGLCEKEVETDGTEV